MKTTAPSLASFCFATFFTAFVTLPAILFANNWLSQYRSRPSQDPLWQESLSQYFSSKRQVIDLNGVWQARKDGESLWYPVSVPGAYEFEGVMEYRKTFSLDSTVIGKTVKLVALGINNRCAIHINGSFVEYHNGGHTSFAVEIPSEKLRPDAENEIRISVDNSLLARGSLPLRHRPHYPFNYGGIFRDIFLQIVPTISIEDLSSAQVFNDDYSGARLTVDAAFRNRLRAPLEDPISWHVEVWDNDESLVGKAQVDSLKFDAGVSQATLDLTFAGVNLWSPDNPALYRLRSFLTRNGEIMDERLSSIGLCEFKSSDRDFKLNGQLYSVRGFDWFETSVGAGPFGSLADLKTAIQRIKDSGANALRFVGAPSHPFFLSLCDEIGLLVFQELPLNMVPDSFFLNSDFKELARSYLNEMLKRDAMHVSLAAWGLGTDLLAERLATEQELNNFREMVQRRSSRPTYLTFHFFREISTRPCADFIINSVYNKNADDAADLLYWQNPGIDLPAMVSLGFPLFAGEASVVDESPNAPAPARTSALLDSQQRQAETFRKMLAAIDSTGRAAGVFIHTFSDWREAKPNLLFAEERSPDVHLSGVVNDGDRRIFYETVSAFFSQQFSKPLAIIAQPAHYPIVYPIVGLAIILILLFNLNRDTRFRGSMRRVFLFPHGFHMELRERRKVQLFHTTIVGLVVFTLLSIIVSSIAFRFRHELAFNAVLDFFITSNALKLVVIRLIWNPVVFIPLFVAFLFLLCAVVTGFLKVLDLVIGENLSIGQYYAMLIWDAANFVWLLPIIPIYFRIISQPSWTPYAILLVLLFAVWTAVRLFRGSRVVFNLTLFNSLSAALILGLLIFGGTWWYLDEHYALADYLPFYLSFL
jgi:hypothetical protein